MKSAIGIGALLMDGLGDTIRVSLTEDPELEIVPCGCVILLVELVLGPFRDWGGLPTMLTGMICAILRRHRVLLCCVLHMPLLFGRPLHCQHEHITAF